MKAHPVADLFPMLAEDELAELAEDIKQRGLLHLAWARLSTANLGRVAIAEGMRQKYAAERLDALREHPGWTLGQIERELFGYIDEDEPADFGDEDES